MTGEWLPPQAPPDGPHRPPAYADTRPNNEPVAAIACGLTGAGLLLWTNGFSSIVSVVLGAFAVFFARRGKRNVEEGRTARHADLADGANVVGWITLGLSIAATIFWILVIVLA